MSQESAPAIPAPEVQRMPLKALGLRTGMALQTRRLKEGASKKESQFFGAIEGKGVMVGPMGSDAVQTGLEEGEVCVVRGFTGQYEFSFLSKVLQTFEKPFAYALLAYPTLVDAHLVRKSMRIRTSWPTSVQLTGDAKEIDVTLIDMSASGAMIKAPSSLAALGDVIQINIAVIIDNAPSELSLQANICHNNKATQEEGFFIGLAFKNLTQQDKLVLNYLAQPPALA
jgi:c-di-GMP-binding flagellar brake protein YcgR